MSKTVSSSSVVETLYMLSQFLTPTTTTTNTNRVCPHQYTEPSIGATNNKEDNSSNLLSNQTMSFLNSVVASSLSPQSPSTQTTSSLCRYCALSDADSSTAPTVDGTDDKLIRAARVVLDPTSVDVCVYHDPCSDGRGAAFCAKLTCPDIVLCGWNHAKMVPKRSTSLESSEELMPEAFQNLLSLVKGKNVLFVDCAPASMEQWRRILTIANKCIVLDHHESNMKQFESEPGCFFDMHRSGCALAWAYFQGPATPLPLVLQMVQKRDLWQIDSLVESFIAWFYDPDVTPQTVDVFFEYYEIESKVVEAVCCGYPLLLKKRAIVETCANRARVATLNGIQIGVVETDLPHYASDIGAKISTKYGAAAVILRNSTASGESKNYKVSLRSHHSSIVNVADVAARFGGGGHPQAASFITSVPVEDLFSFTA